MVSLPAFWAVRNTFPDAHLTLLSNSAEADSKYVLARSVLPEKGLFDNWITYPTVNSKMQFAESFTRLFLEIRRGRYDLLVYLMSRNRMRKSIERDRLFFRLAGITKIIGTEYLLNNLLVYEQPKPLPKVESEVEFFLNCLKSDVFPSIVLKPKPEMLLSEKESVYAEEWLRANCPSNRNLIAIAPGSKWQSKIWDENRFVQLIEKLIIERNIFPIIFGGNEDKETGNRLLKKLGTGANAAGKLNIRQAASALAQCQLYIGNDTGTMHLAASVGTPCVGIFAAIDFDGRWYPFGENHQILRKQVECEGCHSPVSLNNNKCLNLIEVDEVHQACLKVLDKV